MAVNYDRAFSIPVANTDTVIYTASTNCILSNINICNKSATATTFWIWVKALGVTDYYLHYQLTIPGYDTFNRVCGDVIIATDVVYVKATLATLDFSFSFSEIIP